MTLVTGSIKVLDVPDDACITTMRDLVLQLTRYLIVEFDEEKITNVVVSNIEPDTTSRDVIWWQVDNSGNLIGLKVFIQGEWVQVFPTPQQIIRVGGRSDDLDPGYILADDSVAWIDAGMAAYLKTTWYPATATLGVGDVPSYYTIFDVVYVGL